jgi:hypothetical protein
MPADPARPWPSVESRRLHRPRDRPGRRPPIPRTAAYRPVQLPKPQAEAPPATGYLAADDPASTTGPDSPAYSACSGSQPPQQARAPAVYPRCAPSMYFPGPRATGQRRHHPGPAPPDANASDRSRPARERHHARDVQRASLAELRIERVPVERFRFEHGDLSVPARTLRPDMAVVAALADPGRAVLVPPRRPLLADTTLPLLALTHLGGSLPRTSSPAWH